MATEIQTLEPTQRLSITTQPQNFVGAFTQYAQSSNMLGELGASMALNASIEYNKIQGQKLGMNPQGDILPPITAADKAYAEGYIAQSNATLSLQANKMMMEGQLELEKSYRITPDMIQSYSGNMQQGLEKILQQAPSSLQADMRNNFTSSLLSSTGQLTRQYISQNKQQEQATADANLKLQLKQINDYVRAGNIDGAEKVRKQVISESKSRSSIGMYNPTQTKAAIDSANTTYYTAQEINKAEKAIRDKKLPEYLDSIAMQNVQGLGATESDAIKANVYNWANQRMAYRNQEQTLLMTEARYQMSNGTFNDIKAGQLQETLDPANYFNVMTQWSTMQKKSSVGDAIVQGIMSDPSNPRVYAEATATKINQAFDNLVNARQLQTSGAETKEQSEFEIAKTMNRPIPKMVNMMNYGMSSGNAQDMQRAGNTYYGLLQENPNSVQGVNQESIAAFNIYKRNLGDATYKNDAGLAASAARNTVYNKTEEQSKNNARFISSYFNKNLSTADKLTTWARTTSGLEKGVPIFNESGFNLDMQNQFRTNMILTDGDTNMSTNLTREYAQKYYGTTTVNGTTQIVKFPIGKMMGAEYGADGLIQYDAVDQLKKQFNYQKQIFDENKTNSYYEIVDAPDFGEYLSAKDRITKGGIKSTVFNSLTQALAGGGAPVEPQFIEEDRTIVDKFENPKPIKIRQVFRNNTFKEMEVYIQPSPNVVVSPDGEVLGGYLPMTIDATTGVPMVLRGTFGNGRSMPIYEPNIKWIRDNYLSVNGIVNTTWEEYLNRSKSILKPAAEDIQTFFGQ